MLKNWIVCIALIGIYIFLCKDNLNRNLSYDEVDYMKAAKQGVWANAVSSNSISFNDFLKLGRAKWDKNEKEIREISKTVPNPKEDVFFLKHYHLVLPIYYMGLFQDQDYATERTKFRSSVILMYIFLLAVICYFMYKVINKEKLNTNHYIFLLPIFALSPVTIHVFNTFNMHAFFAIFLVMFLLAYRKYLLEQTNKNLFVLSLTLALVMLSLETFPIAIFILFLSYLFFKHYKLIPIKKVVLVFILGFGIATVLWPAFIFNGEMFKSVGMYFFRIFGKSNIEYENVSYLGNWINVVKYAPILTILVFGQLFYSLLNWRTFFNNDSVVNFLFFFGLLYCVIMTPFVININYVYPGIVLLFISVTIFYVRFIKDNKKQLILFSALSVLSIGNLVLQLNKKENTLLYNPDKDNLIADYDFLNTLKTKEGLVIGYGGHRYRYIDKDDTFFDLDNAVKNQGKFTHRFDYNHDDLKEDFLNKKYEVLFISKDMQKVPANVDRILNEFKYTHKLEGKDIVAYSYKDLSKK